MRAKALRKAAWLLALSMAGAGIALASNTSWFAVDTTYGTNGVSEALTSTSYGRSNAVDHSDVNHRVYSLVGAHPSGYVGPFTLTRRLSSGAIDTAFGASGVTTSFANYNDPNSVNAFDALCIGPLQVSGWHLPDDPLGPFPPTCSFVNVFACQAQGRFFDFNSCQCL